MGLHHEGNARASAPTPLVAFLQLAAGAADGTRPCTGSLDAPCSSVGKAMCMGGELPNLYCRWEGDELDETLVVVDGGGDARALRERILLLLVSVERAQAGGQRGWTGSASRWTDRQAHALA